jgi:hypothetical protein
VDAGYTLAVTLVVVCDLACRVTDKSRSIPPVNIVWESFEISVDRVGQKANGRDARVFPPEFSSVHTIPRGRRFAVSGREQVSWKAFH